MVVGRTSASDRRRPPDLREDLRRLSDAIGIRKQELATVGIRVAHEVVLKELPPDVLPPHNQFAKEPFGFADGVSQPIIQGTPRALSSKNAHQVVPPGEFVFGYPDNLGYLPPSPAVADQRDPHGLLPALGFDPSRQRPNFSDPAPTASHDLGRNGTFLVVRQLEQNKAAFGDFKRAAATAIATDPRAPALPREQARGMDWGEDRRPLAERPVAGSPSAWTSRGRRGR